MNEERVILGAYWTQRRITAGQFIHLCFDFLAALRDFSTAFDQRCVAIGEFPNVVPADVPKDYKSFEELMLKAIPNPKHVYTNPDPAIRHLTLDSTIPVGFRASFSDPGNSGLSISIGAGNYGQYSGTNSVLIKIPPEYREFWDTERAKELMKLVVSIWQPTFGTLTSSELRAALDAERLGNITLGIVTYFADKAAADIARDCATVEAVPDRGVLITINAPYPWAASVDRFSPCYRRLNDAGLLKLA